MGSSRGADRAVAINSLHMDFGAVDLFSSAVGFPGAPRPARANAHHTALVPNSVQNAHAHRRATEQFLVQNLHTTANRTGVLIFVSVAERHAEILADKGIDAKVPPGTWQQIVDTLTREIADGRAADGFVHAIEQTGHHLSQHFPPGSHDPDELPNHLIVLDG